MTELEAVNTILATIGEAPVTSLAGTPNAITDSALAEKTLDEIRIDVCAEGWSWNIKKDVDISPNASNVYVLPAGTLSVQFSPNQYPDSRYVLRGLRIYDRIRHRFDFGAVNNSETLHAAQVIEALAWDQLPHAAQQYVMVRAARIFSDRYVASSVVFTYTVADEDQARVLLMRAEESTLDNNLLWGNDRGAVQGLGYIPALGTRYRSR